MSDTWNKVVVEKKTEVHVGPRAFTNCPYECANHGHVVEVDGDHYIVEFDNLRSSMTTEPRRGMFREGDFEVLDEPR